MRETKPAAYAEGHQNVRGSDTVSLDHEDSAMWHGRKILPLVLLLSIVVSAVGQEETYKQVRVAVDLVLVNAIVTNGNNEVVTDLRPEDFSLSEDKVQQDIQYFSTESGPISLGI